MQILVMFALLSGIMYTPPNNSVTLSRALLLAGESGKHLILKFSTTDCPDCAEVDAFFNNNQYADLLSTQYVIAPVDIQNFDGKACAELYDVENTPAIVIISPEDKVVFHSGKRVSLTHLHRYFKDPTSFDEELLSDAGALPETEEAAEIPGNSASATGQYSVQCGFFSVPDNARQLKTRLLKAGARPVTIQEEVRETKLFYRVLSGAFQSRQNAEFYVREIRSKGFQGKIYHQKSP